MTSLFSKESNYAAFVFMAKVADQVGLILLVCVWALGNAFCLQVVKCFLNADMTNLQLGSLKSNEVKMKGYSARARVRNMSCSVLTVRSFAPSSTSCCNCMGPHYSLLLWNSAGEVIFHYTAMGNFCPFCSFNY